jgi:L-rhamnose mutarotase
MAKMEADEATQHWWTFTKPCFERFSICPDSEFYADLKQIFYFE